MKNNLVKFIFAILLLVQSVIFPWGNVAHSIINRNAVKFLPSQMQAYYSWAEYLATHASDADYRKSYDTSEGPKHYLDADNYPEFFSNNFIRDLDSLIQKYGYQFVLQNGFLPWTIKNTYDSLVISLAQRRWNNAMQFAADLGHYIGDLHQPLHLTKNYDGQLTNQKGVHSRYETQLLNRYSNQIVFTTETVSAINNIEDKIFELLYANYIFLDSILIYDNLAKAQAGGSYNDQYYAIYWNYSQNFTKNIIRNASLFLGAFIYSAWLEAGQPQFSPNSVEELIGTPTSFTLFQNYPNPFNYSTQIKFYIPSEMNSSNVVVELYDSLGKKISTLFDGELKSGFHQFEVDGKYLKLSTGTYLYTIKLNGYSETKKMTFLK